MWIVFIALLDAGDSDGGRAYGYRSREEDGMLMSRGASEQEHRQV